MPKVSGKNIFNFRHFKLVCLPDFVIQAGGFAALCICENPCPTRPNGIAGRANGRRACPIKYFDKMKISDSWRILVTGVTSIHGWPIFTQLNELLPESSLYGLRPPKSDVPDSDNISAFCITERAELERIRDEFKPTHVIHCAGVCDLDVCEDRPEWAHALNVLGTKAVADVFGYDIPILYMSTVLVFSGYNSPTGGYTEDDEPDPSML